MKASLRYLAILSLCLVCSLAVKAGTNPPQTAPVFFSLAGGLYNTPQQLVLTDATPGAVIYYRTDGKTPNASSTVYTGPIVVSSTELVTAIAIAPGYSSSVESAKQYIYVPFPLASAPYFSLAGGNYSKPQTLILTSSTPGASICYTTNGQSPVDKFSEFDDCIPYTGPITISHTELVKAAAKAPGYNVSNVSSKQYYLP
ncbi:hypothetical protein DYQ86_12925 [Acidobacteria bacterium AB60]|nr:hypothetical protein DYQ86_12925 [Acidobacteria bacterium AB60]